MTTIPIDTENVDGPPSYREALASVQSMLDECEKDPEKIKLYFGYIETSAGDL